MTALLLQEGKLIFGILMRYGLEQLIQLLGKGVGHFVHIRYFAVRDGEGTYLGCLEATQDVSAIRTFEGERRLLAEGGAGMTETVNPTTKVGPLLDAHPELEEVLVAISPEFRRLKNPLLRRTVARVATLEHAARIGGVPVPELVGRLRAALGQASPESMPGESGAADDAPEAAWLAGATPAATLEAEAILAAGKTPVAAFVERLTQTSPGEVVLLVAPFNPAPLIDAVKAKGYEVYAAARTAQLGDVEIVGVAHHFPFFGSGKTVIVRP